MNPYVIGGTILLIAILSWQLKSSITRNGELSAKLENQAAETLEATDANDTNMITITTLRSRILVMVEERRVDTERREQILVERDTELTQARVENDRLRGEREDEVDTNFDCAELQSLSVDFFCPIAGEQLRQRSRGPGSNEDGDSDGAGGGH
jgi:E3 ubiquitin-protein ligase DOA10